MRRAVFSCLVLTLVLVMSVPAAADVFGPIGLVSESNTEAIKQQADYAHDPAISGNGEYIAWDGSFGGQTGVFRSHLLPPNVVEVEQVAGGDAELPSISENGRYVSFTTTQALVPGDENPGPDVYVRDMDVPCTMDEGGSCQPCPEQEHCPFTLASAVNGSEVALSYTSGEPGRLGSVASGRSALSANGREVAFVTTATSNLVNPSEVNTPALQVAVRNIETKTTQLVSVARESGTGRELPGVPVSGSEGATTYGAVYPGLKGPAFRAPEFYALTSTPGASISADGSTVAWLGRDVPAQASTLLGEPLIPKYTEPLWRRIADGPEAATRRVTGGQDPTSPGCAASGETSLQQLRSASDPCQGPFLTETGLDPGTWGETGTSDVVPQLSADGYTVAFVATAPLLTSGEDFGLGEQRNGDLYVVNMQEGLSRTQALNPLTELASGNDGDLATDAPIIDLGISPDGSQVAFTTQRTVFPLGSPAYISAPAAKPGMTELFDVDLGQDTITRVSEGFEGGPSERPHKAVSVELDPYGQAGDGALSPSFSDNGEVLAFSSTASNLAYGDGNTPALGASLEAGDGSDAFVVERKTFSSSPTPQEISSAPASRLIAPLWRLGATAHSRANGSVVVDVLVPGAGTLRAIAQGAVRIKPAHSSAKGSAKKGSASPKGHASATTVATRTLAAATAPSHAGNGGLLALTLTLTAHYRPLAAQRGGRSATVSLAFAAPGHPTLHEGIAVTFLRTIKPPPKPKHKPTPKTSPPR
jgi:WD40-like Beta Propeller Repeat